MGLRVAIGGFGLVEPGGSGTQANTEMQIESTIINGFNTDETQGVTWYEALALCSFHQCPLGTSAFYPTSPGFVSLSFLIFSLSTLRCVCRRFLFGNSQPKRSNSMSSCGEKMVGGRKIGGVSHSYPIHSQFHMYIYIYTYIYI